MKRSADDATGGSAESGTSGSVKRLMTMRSHVTMSGLACVLAEVRDIGLPNAFSRRTQARARRSGAAVPTPYGPVMQTRKLLLTNGEMDLPVQAPLPMLWAAAQRGPFGDLLAEALVRAPATPAQPWHLILYSDEVTPGNALKPDNRRKMQCVYWSFLELGSAALCHTDAWFLVAAVRSNVVQELEGGMSHLFKALMPLFFDQATHHLATGGVHLQVREQALRLHAKFGVMVSDESAIRQVLLAKGAGGNKPCVCCKNIVSLASELHVHDASGYAQPVSCLDVQQWDPQTDASVLAIVQRLGEARAVLPVGQFEELEKLLGFNWGKYSVLQVPEFAPISTLMWDWMHVYMVNGVFNQEIGRLMHSLHRHGATWARLHEYLSRWTWPRATGSASALCNAKRAKSYYEAEVFKCSASEGLSVYPVLRKFLVDVVRPTGVCAEAVASAIHLCDAVKLLHSINRGATVRPARLMEAILTHLRSYQAAYGVEGWLPKHHYSLHLPGMLERHGTLISCFTHERKHKVVKRYAQHHFNTISMEKGIVEEITLQHLQDLDGSFVRHGLLCPAAAPAKLVALMETLAPGAGRLMAARQMAQGGCTFSKDDVALLHLDGAPAVGEIWFLASADDKLFACVSLWEAAGAASERAARYRVSSSPRVVDAGCLQEPLIYSRSADLATVILPT